MIPVPVGPVQHAHGTREEFHILHFLNKKRFRFLKRKLRLYVPWVLGFHHDPLLVASWE